MPLSESALNTFCGFKGVSSVFSFPCHPSRRGGLQLGQLGGGILWGRMRFQEPAVRVQCTQYRVANWDFIDDVCAKCASLHFPKTSVCNSCTKSSGGSGSLPVTSNTKQQEGISGTHRLGASVTDCLAPWGWIVKPGPLVRDPRQARTIARETRKSLVRKWWS